MHKDHPQPPGWTDQFLEWRLGADTSEEVIGDLHELFEEYVRIRGLRQARLFYILHALSFLRPLPRRLTKGRNRLAHSNHSNYRNTMFLNYFKVAWRNLMRNKVNTTINISGLTLGLTCCLILFLIIKYETSFDKHHANADRIYKVTTKYLTEEGGYNANAPIPVGKALKETFPEIEEVTTTVYEGDLVMKVGDKLLKQEGVGYISPAFFNIFDAKWVVGNPATSLSDPNAVVLSKSVAQKFFGSNITDDIRSAIGKTITLKSRYTLQVTGIIEDFPPTTDLPFQVLISYASLPSQTNQDLNSWINLASSYSHFVLLKKGVDPHKLEDKIPSMLKKYEVEGKAKHAYLLQPIGEMHSDERFGNYRDRFMPKENINGLILIGIFILLIASINFINLATAQSVRRSKEVGIRKVIGSTRRQIIFQFTGETFITALAAMLLSIIIAFLTLPHVNTFLDSQITLQFFQDGSILIFIACITVAVTVLAGFYPAFIVSGFKPISALKNKITAPASGALTLRRGLIVAQFIIAQLLIVGTLVVFDQLEFLRTNPIGYNKEGLMILSIPESLDKSKRNLFRTQIMELPAVKNVSYSFIPPSSSGNWSAGFNYSGSGLKDDISCIMYPVDEHYINTYSIELLAGRGLKDGDSTSVVVNEMVLQKMNIKTPQEAIGTQIIQFNKRKSIVGVVKNFNAQSLKKATDPIVMLYMPWVYVGGVKIGLQNVKSTVDQIEQIWKQMFPETLFEFSFLDEQIAEFYKEEVKIFQLLRIFAAIAILISCLGLYGLVSFMAVQRTKEIGIRKVLGASTTHIVNLFTKEFVVLIIIAFLLAAPIAWYALHAWLEDYANKTDVGVASFLMALVLSLVLAGCTILYRSITAAHSNTIKNIRTE